MGEKRPEQGEESLPGLIETRRVVVIIIAERGLLGLEIK